jgi:hypothetical protein
MPENHKKPESIENNRSLATECQACSCSAQKHGGGYYTELIRIITGLFVGVIALMTFLLTVGFQRPHVDFAWALYATIISLALNLLGFVGGHIFAPSLRPTTVEAGSDSAEKAAEAHKRAHKRRKLIHAVQQILFIVAVLAITWLALSTAHFFFTIQASPAAAPTPQ